MVQLGSEEIIIKFARQRPVRRAFFILEGGHWRLEVSHVGQTIGPDRTELRQLEMALVEFADVATDRAFRESYTIP
jgi:hypothetical protein